METINNGYPGTRARGNQPSRLPQKASVDGYRTLPSRPQPQTSSNGGDMAVLQSALDKVDLSYLSDEERAKLLGVVQRDLEIRAAEKQRLNRFRSSILRRDREAAAKSQNTVAESNNCLLCGRKFYMLFQPKQVCSSCQRPVCRQCSEQIPGTEKVLCSLCVRETGYRAMKCNWFYDTVLTRFREFGSTAVVKNLFGNKYQHVQSMAEEELAGILNRYRGLTANETEVTVNDQKIAPQSFDQAREIQAVKMRNKLKMLMNESTEEYRKLDADKSLTESQKHWRENRIGMDFRKSAAEQLRNFSQTLYITTERSQTLQGKTTRHTSQYVVNTLQTEVSNLIGHPVKDTGDNQSVASDDDLESVAYADREGVEDRLARELLEKVIEDSKLPPGMNKSMPPSGSYGSGLMQPTMRLQHIAVVESSPTRMEMKVLFNDSNDFSWLREDPSGNRVPVKYDFHIEHVITGSNDPSGRENFVLSNSGKVGSEATQVLARKHKRLLDSGAPQGVVIQHQLIIWAAKLEDAGKYFGVTKIPQPNGLSVLQETEYRLEVRPQPRFPLLPVQPPEFIRPLTLRTKTMAGQSNPVLELTCSVASNPAPRCLFYKNNSPVPVVILPLLTSEQDKTDITLRSFSGKYAVVSSPHRQSVVSATVGYLRNLTLLIHNLGPEDVATYTCRAWNYTGKTETEAKVLRSDLQVPPADQPPSPQYEQTGSLSERMRQAQMETMKSARDIESTARTHGDVMPPNRHVDSRPPLPSSAGNTVNKNELPEGRDRLNNLPKVSIEYETPSSGRDYSPRGAQPSPSYASQPYPHYNSQYSTPTTISQRSDRYFPEGQEDRDPVTNQGYSPHPSRTHRPSYDDINSDGLSETSSVIPLPLARSSVRRSGGPKVVIDRRSQRRRSRSKNPEYPPPREENSRGNY